MELKALVKEVERIARGAGELVTSMKKPQVFTKDGHANFVTQADIASQSYIVEQLKPLLPQANFFAEEQEVNRMGPGYNWVIDPIDGTTNFMRDYGYSAISIGLVKDGESVLGVVYNPYADEAFTAVLGEGAALNGVPIHCAEYPMEKALVVIGTSPYYRELVDETMDTVKRIFLRCGDIRRSGSAALDLCSVACGRCDGFYESVLSPWDYAASAVILKEAGAEIIAPRPAGLTFHEKQSILAASKTIFEDLRKLVEN